MNPSRTLAQCGPLHWRWRCVPWVLWALVRPWILEWALIAPEVAAAWAVLPLSPVLVVQMIELPVPHHHKKSPAA